MYAVIVQISPQVCGFDLQHDAVLVEYAAAE
jgi:hypothetical protein